MENLIKITIEGKPFDNIREMAQSIKVAITNVQEDVAEPIIIDTIHGEVIPSDYTGIAIIIKQLPRL